LISLDQARELVLALEHNDVAAANEQVESLLELKDNPIYQQVGVLTRELHDTVSQFKEDLGTSGVTGQEITDIRARLHHVIELMESAANESLAAVEESVPLAKGIIDGADKIAEGWDRFRNRELDVEQFRELSDDITEFMSIAAGNSERLHLRLNEVMMAQSFQDLSGQIIHRVVDVIGRVEDSLIELVRLSGQEEEETRSEGDAHGPVVPGLKQSDVVKSQDEVDDLLSSLGF
jgi:chemotaxis protein CheZ